MKFKIKNFGNIKEAEIELKNLTVFVGENNTNKTWTAYLIYVFLSKEFILRSKENFYKDYLEKLQNTENTFNYSIEEYIKIKEQTLKELAPLFIIKNLRNFSINLEFSKEETKTLEKELMEGIDKINSMNENKRRAFLIALKEGDKYELLNKLKFSIILEKFLILIGNKKENNLEPFNIPAERKAIIQFANLITLGEKNINELRSLILELLKTEGDKINLQEILQIFDTGSFQYNYPKPVIDFKDFVSRLSLLKEKANPLNRELLRLFENSILEGKIHIDQTGKLIYHMNNQNDLDVSISSSMVKSLSGIDIYLKYRAEKNGLVIIDEPEMNLHPEAQVKLIEFLTIMANKGIKVLITTHSPYIVDHLINLIEGYYSEKKDKEKLFWQPKYIKSGSYDLIKPSDIFISKDDVSVYFFRKDGVVEAILDREERTIDWRTFSQISERISNIYWEL